METVFTVLSVAYWVLILFGLFAVGMETLDKIVTRIKYGPTRPLKNLPIDISREAFLEEIGIDPKDIKK